MPFAPLSRSLRLRLLAAVLFAQALILSSCTDKTCRGVIIAGECQTPCDEAKCGRGEQCVENQCAERCSANDDCASGRCQRQEADNGDVAKFCTGAAVDAGASAPQSSDTQNSEGVATPMCRNNSECDAASGEHCVEGLCRQTCLLHEHCGAAGGCTLAARDDDGNDVFLCEGDSFPRGIGEYGSACPTGNVDCAAEFRCVSAGEGDSDAYCTNTGCDTDSECPSGYFCSHNRTVSAPCSSACELAGAPADPRCIPNDAIGPGLAFRCAEEGGLELRICLKREYCGSCESDADCRSVPNQICAAGGDGTKMCTVLCDPDTNSCPWGSASSCQVWDPQLGQPTCGHRSGSCHGSGNSCDPCLDDRDCPRGFCGQFPYTAEQFCVDEGATCACAVGETQCFGGGCPETPGGLEMNCVPRADDAAPDACFGARTVATDPASALGCWPPEGEPL